MFSWPTTCGAFRMAIVFVVSIHMCVDVSKRTIISYVVLTVCFIMNYDCSSSSSNSCQKYYQLNVTGHVMPH